MSDLHALEALQALHGELLAVCQHRFEGLQTLELLLEENKKAFEKFLDKKSRNQQSREAVGKRRLLLSLEGIEDGREEMFANGCDHL